MRFRVLKFRFTTPIHLATARGDYIKGHRYLHSDSLYAAIIQSWATLGMTSVLEAYNQGALNFAFSSLFPFVESSTNEPIFFLPRPSQTLQKDPESSLQQQQKLRKDYKRIEWVDVKLFKEWQEDPNTPMLKADHLKGRYLTAANWGVDNEDFMYTQMEPKVTITRDIQESTPYYLERLCFEKGSGWYGLFNGSEEAWKVVQSALLFLEEEGLGTDRHQGNGKFKVYCAPSDEAKIFHRLLQSKSTTNYYYNLSLYNPSKLDAIETLLGAPQEATFVGYHLVKRGGWLTTYPYQTLRKQPIHFFKEGSILRFMDTKPSPWDGARVNVAPQEHPHPVWRVGQSLFIPINF